MSGLSPVQSPSKEWAPTPVFKEFDIHGNCDELSQANYHCFPDFHPSKMLKVKLAELMNHLFLFYHYKVPKKIVLAVEGEAFGEKVVKIELDNLVSKLKIGPEGVDVVIGWDDPKYTAMGKNLKRMAAIFNKALKDLTGLILKARKQKKSNDSIFNDKNGPFHKLIALNPKLPRMHIYTLISDLKKLGASTSLTKKEEGAIPVAIKNILVKTVWRPIFDPIAKATNKMFFQRQACLNRLIEDYKDREDTVLLIFGGLFHFLPEPNPQKITDKMSPKEKEILKKHWAEYEKHKTAVLKTQEVLYKRKVFFWGSKDHLGPYTLLSLSSQEAKEEKKSDPKEAS